MRRVVIRTPDGYVGREMIGSALRHDMPAQLAYVWDEDAAEVIARGIDGATIEDPPA
jgi:hypothetical protein